MRRRLRRQRQMREALLLDLGALVFELHRQGRREPELLQAKAAELTAVDEEVRALAEALGSGQTVMQLVATGVAGSCEQCGSLMSVDAAYCASCGAPAVPALAGDGERSAFGPEGAADEQGALGVAEETTDHSPQTTVHSPQAAEEDTGAIEETIAEEAADEQAFAEPVAGDEPVIEEPAAEEEPSPEEERPPEEGPAAEEAPAAEEEPAAAEEPRTVVEEPREPAEPSRALADDAFDGATRVIRTGIARGRDWLRGRRTRG
jgi:hypothetical protein